MKTATRSPSQEYEHKRRQREQIARETQQADHAAATERRERAETAAREREKRDAAVRKRAFEFREERIAVRRAAEDAQIDFEAACGALSAGTGSLERAQRLQRDRDEARRLMEIYALAAGELNADPALAGRR